MKRFTFSCLVFCAAITFFFTSCHSGDKKKTEAPTVTTTKEPAQTRVVNNIVTTPENMVVVIHKVANYAKWKPGYDMNDAARLAHGLHNYVIGRGVYDSNMVLVALKADDIAKAKAFTSGTELKTVMQKAGVVSQPTISVLVATWQDTATIGSLFRSLASFKVKDWDTWQKSFQDGKQERVDNGIMTRVIGHDADNNKNVSVVTALSDTAKAFAYYKSDALKKRREAGGVIGEPKRFIFRIAQRY